MSGDGHPDVMPAEEWEVPAAHQFRLPLDFRAAVATRCQHRVVKYGDDVGMPCTIELLELAGHPGELSVVEPDVGIDGEEEVASVSECERRISRQPPVRSVGRPELRHGCTGIAQSEVAVRVADRTPAAVAEVEVVIADNKQVRDATAVNQLADNGREADIPRSEERRVGKECRL